MLCVHLSYNYPLMLSVKILFFWYWLAVHRILGSRPPSHLFPFSDTISVLLVFMSMQSLVSQQQLELISERARHSDEAQEKVAFPLFLCSFFR